MNQQSVLNRHRRYATIAELKRGEYTKITDGVHPLYLSYGQKCYHVRLFRNAFYTIPEMKLIDNQFHSYRLAVSFFLAHLYDRKTIDEYQIQGDYGLGWECDTVESTMKEARATLKDYRKNCAFPLRIKRCLIKLDEVKDSKYTKYETLKNFRKVCTYLQEV